MVLFCIICVICWCLLLFWLDCVQEGWPSPLSFVSWSQNKVHWWHEFADWKWQAQTKGGVGFKEGGVWRIRPPVIKTLLVLASSESVAFSVFLHEQNTLKFFNFGFIWGLILPVKLVQSCQSETLAIRWVFWKICLTKFLSGRWVFYDAAPHWISSDLFRNVKIH